MKNDNENYEEPEEDEEETEDEEEGGEEYEPPLKHLKKLAMKFQLSLRC